MVVCFSIPSFLSYDVYVYRVYLFKELEGQHQAGMSYSSISFLKRHDFDFNRVCLRSCLEKILVGKDRSDVCQHVRTRGNPSENRKWSRWKRVLSLFGSKILSRLFDETFTSWLETLRSQVDFKIACEPDVFDWKIISSNSEKEVEIELCKNSKATATKAMLHSTLLDRPLSKLENLAVLLDLTHRFPYVEFRIVKGQTVCVRIYG